MNITAIDTCVLTVPTSRQMALEFPHHKLVVAEIATDKLWADFKELASTHGLAACWSQPIVSSHGRVLGTVGCTGNYTSLRRC